MTHEQREPTEQEHDARRAALPHYLDPRPADDLACLACGSTAWFWIRDDPRSCVGCGARHPLDAAEDGSDVLESRPFVTLSTEHLTEPDREAIEAGGCPLAVWNGDHGWFAYVADGENAIETDPDERSWPGLLAVCRWAERCGVQFVRFDIDGPRRSDLPSWPD